MLNKPFQNLIYLIFNHNIIILFHIENKIIKADESIHKKLSKPEHINYFFSENESYYTAKQTIDEFNQII